MNQKVLVVSVKDTDGEWQTLKVLEVRFAQPYAVSLEPGGMTTIKSSST